MTKEELEKEAEEYLKKKNYTSGYIGYFASGYCKQAYVDSAEPREKQIQIDAEQIRALQKQNGELTDRVKELEAQIEKMKCCSNCENWNWKHSRCEKKLKGDCFKQSKWVLRKILK